MAGELRRFLALGGVYDIASGELRLSTGEVIGDPSKVSAITSQLVTLVAAGSGKSIQQVIQEASQEVYADPMIYSGSENLNEAIAANVWHAIAASEVFQGDLNQTGRVNGGQVTLRNLDILKAAASMRSGDVRFSGMIGGDEFIAEQAEQVSLVVSEMARDVSIEVGEATERLQNAQDNPAAQLVPQSPLLEEPLPQLATASPAVQVNTEVQTINAPVPPEALPVAPEAPLVPEVLLPNMDALQEPPEDVLHIEPPAELVGVGVGEQPSVPAAPEPIAERGTVPQRPVVQATDIREIETEALPIPAEDAALATVDQTPDEETGLTSPEGDLSSGHETANEPTPDHPAPLWRGGLQDHIGQKGAYLGRHNQAVWGTPESKAILEVREALNEYFGLEGPDKLPTYEATGGAADNIIHFGPQMQRLMRQFQKENGLGRDGVVGPETAAYLLTVTGEGTVNTQAASVIKAQLEAARAAPETPVLQAEGELPPVPLARPERPGAER